MCEDVSSYSFVIFFFINLRFIYFFLNTESYTKQLQLNVVPTCTVIYMICSFFFFFPVSTGSRNHDSNKTSTSTTVFL